MSDFEPTTDFPEFIDDDDAIVVSAAAARDAAIQQRRTNILRVITAVVGVALVARGFPWLRVIIAVLAFYVLMKLGLGIAGALARPIPEAPPAGELRRVKLTYRCDICGTEIRMTRANDQVPEAPRHCTEDMHLTTNLEDVL